MDRNIGVSGPIACGFSTDGGVMPARSYANLSIVQPVRVQMIDDIALLKC